MKIVFLKDIPRVGQRGQIKEVADGYANMLIRDGSASRATTSVIAKIEEKKKNESINKEKEKENFKNFLQLMNGLNIKIKVRANEKGHLFQSVHKSDVLKEIKKYTKIELEESQLNIGHIKEIGMHAIVFDDGNNKGKYDIEILAI